MTGLIDVGGGLRGVYSAGICDALIDAGTTFDCYIGVSAGSANLSTLVAKQRDRLLKFYIEYTFRRRYMSLDNLLRRGSYLDLDYIYGDLSCEGGEYPIDFETFAQSTAGFIVVATDAESGKPHYFSNSDIQPHNLDAIKASCNIPVIAPPYEIDGHYYFDGGLSDPVPYKKAFFEGCDRLVVILTRPRDFRKTTPDYFDRLSILMRDWPNALADMYTMNDRYNEAVDELKAYEAAGSVYIAAPSNTFGMETLTKDKQAIQKLYDLGLHDAAGIVSFVNG